jgi:hypothetical protein
MFHGGAVPTPSTIENCTLSGKDSYKRALETASHSDIPTPIIIQPEVQPDWYVPTTLSSHIYCTASVGGHI